MLARTLRGVFSCGLMSAILLLFTVAAQAVSIDPIPPTKINSQTVSGDSDPGATVTVLCPGASVGNVSYPTEGRWLVQITGLSEGDNSVTASSTTGSPTVATANILVDPAAPAQALSMLESGAVTTNPTLNVSGVASDGNGSGVVSVMVNGQSASLAADGSFSQALRLSVGTNSITSVATDAAGNSTQVTRLVTLDPSAPRLEIGSPADNLATDQTPVTVTGEVGENIQIELSVNGGLPEAVQVSGTHFSLDAGLAPGLNTLAITARDQNANSSTVKRTVVYDATKPGLQILDPPQDIVTNQPGYTIKGKVSDPQCSVSVTIDGTTSTATLDGGSFEQLAVFGANKTYQVTATASAPGGSVTSVARNIIYDSVPPAIIGASSTTPAGNYGAGQSINVTLVFSEPVSSPGLAISLSSQATLLTGALSGASSFSGSYLVAEGQNSALLRVTSLSGTLTDYAGNQSANPPIPGGGNIADAVAIVVDTTPPIATIGTRPPDPVNVSTDTISFSMDEPGSSQCSIDGGDYAGCSSPCVLTGLADGRHSFSVRGIDLAGNLGAAQSYSWTVDTAAPSVNAGQSLVRNAPFTQTATATDATALAFLWTKQSGPGNLSFGSPGALVTTIAASQDGLYLLRLTATDAAGNSAFSDLALTWDTTAPSVSAGGNKIANAAFTQTAAASDATALSYRWSQESGSGTVSFSSQDAPVTTIAASQDGLYLLRLTATDAAGNSASSDLTLTWDTTAPSVSAGGNKIANAAFTQTAAASDATALSYRWSQQSGPGSITFGSPNDRVTTIRANTDASYLLRLTVTDAAGNSSFDEMTLIWDTVNPYVSAGASGAHNGTYTQVATVSDPQAVSVSWSLISGPGPVTFGTPASASTTVTAGAEGSYLLQMTGTDAAGNTASSQASLTWDQTAPVLALEALPNNSYTHEVAFPISGSAGDALSGLQSLVVNGVQIALDANGAFSYSLTLSDGPNVVTTVARDLAGNSTFDVRTIFLDQLPPEVTIDTLGNDLKTNQSSIKLAGTVNKQCQMTIKVSGAGLERSFEVQATGGSYALQIDGLAVGPNTIEVTATSNAGLHTAVSITVTYDNQKPVLDVASPSGVVRASGNSITFSGTASDSHSGVSITVTAGTDTYNPPLVNGSFSQTIALNEEKVYLVTVTATNEAGNQSVVTRQVINGKITGDLDGINGVSLSDALLALQISVGLVPPDAKYLLHGDIGPLKSGVPAPDGKIDISDAVLILRLVVGGLTLPE